MPFFIVFITLLIISTSLYISNFTPEYSYDNNKIKKLDKEIKLITSSLNTWVSQTSLGQIKKINFDTLYTEGFLYPNTTITNTSYDANLQLAHSDILWQVIPDITNGGEVGNIFIDFSNDDEMMKQSKFYEIYLGKYLCNEEFNGSVSLYSNAYDGNSNYTQTGTIDDGKLSCLYPYQFIPNDFPILFHIYANGDLDYINIFESTLCYQLQNSDSFSTADENSSYTFFTTQDGTCEGKNKTYTYTDFNNADANGNFDVEIIYKNSSTAPSLGDR